VAANKSDSELEKRKVDSMTAKAFCEENSMLFFETSALSGANVSQMFEQLSEKIAIRASALR
jgi:Ras-related protein Rab-5C